MAGLVASSSHLLASSVLRDSANLQCISSSTVLPSSFSVSGQRLLKFVPQPSKSRSLPVCRNMTARKEQGHVVHDSKSEPPFLFDGTTRLYYSSRCPYAQRVWIARNFKGLDEIQLVELNLADKPAWYKERVYPVGKVPALEHKGKVMGESLDLLEYLDDQFGGAPIYPKDTLKKHMATEVVKHIDNFVKAGYTALSLKEANFAIIEDTFGPALNHLECTLGNYSDEGPFFLGTFGVVEIAYAPFIERLQLGLRDFLDYDMTVGRPKLKKWIEALDTVEAYTSTKMEPKVLHDLYKKMLEVGYFTKIGLASQTTKTATN